MKRAQRALSVTIAASPMILATIITGAQAIGAPLPDSTRTWVTVQPGLEHTCGILSDGTLWCWGDNHGGALGTGDGVQHLTPAQVGTDTNWSSVTTSGFHTCAIKTDASLWCWGDNDWGEVGDGTREDIRTVPVRIGTAGWIDVTIGRWHTCAVQTDGSLWCWGINGSGQLGLGDGVERDSPTRVGTGNTWATTGAEDDTSCATQTNGTAWCWGNNVDGQLGDGTTQSSTVPKQIGTDTDWVQLSAGGFSTCATKTDHTLWCWGSNSRGLLGQGRHPAHPLTPAQVGSDATWAQTGMGWFHNCATKATGSLWCWGWNKYGQLGDDGPQNGRHSKQYTPIRIGHAAWTGVSSGDDQSCGVRANGTAWCWGNNLEGELGNGTRNPSPVPVQVTTP